MLIQASEVIIKARMIVESRSSLSMLIQASEVIIKARMIVESRSSLSMLMQASEVNNTRLSVRFLLYRDFIKNIPSSLRFNVHYEELMLLLLNKFS